MWVVGCGVLPLKITLSGKKQKKKKSRKATGHMATYRDNSADTSSVVDDNADTHLLSPCASKR